MSFLLLRPLTNLRIRLAEAIRGDPPRLRMRPLETERLLLRRLNQEDRGDIAGWEAWANTQHGNEVEAQKFLDFCFREYRESRINPWGIVIPVSQNSHTEWIATRPPTIRTPNTNGNRIESLCMIAKDGKVG